MSAKQNNIERFHFLDGMRGYAILITIFTHSITANILIYLDKKKLFYISDVFGGFTSSGPSLFFVLSGMVILRPYLRGQKIFKPVSYVKGRIRRLYPAYFIALVFGTFVVWFNNYYATWYNDRGMRMKFSWLETLKEALVINFDGQYYNLAWWSLSVEMFFYMLVPLMIFIAPNPKKLSDTKLYSIIVTSIITVFVIQYISTLYFPRVYSLDNVILNVGIFLDFAICFILGMLLAAKDFEIKHAYVFIVSGVIITLSSYIYFPLIHAKYLALQESGYALLYSGIIILAFHYKSVNKFWNAPVLIWYGERSYSLYLIHFSVFYLVDNIVSHFMAGRNIYYAILTRGIGIPLAIIACVFLFHYVERKCVRGLNTDHIIWPWQIMRLRKEKSINDVSAI